MDYTLRAARPDDRALIFNLKAESVRPYVEEIWGWDEDYQQRDFSRDFAAIGQFQVIQVNGKFAGFLQASFVDPCYQIAELHLLAEYRGNGIGSDILRRLQKSCAAQNHRIRLGCFKKNHRAKALYEKLGFCRIAETETHVLLEYSHK